MKENVQSYYASSDLFKDKLMRKYPNYLLLFVDLGTLNQESSSYSYDEVFGYSDPLEESVFTPKNYKILSANTTNVDPKITGFIQIMENDPNLQGKFRVTSMYRAGAKTALGNTSWHSKGLAADIVPTSIDFKELEKLMMLNPTLVAYCQKYGLGILDEYTKEGQKRPTGSTGPVMHIGPDNLAKTDFLKLLKKYGYS